MSFVFPRPSLFPEAKPRETLRSRGNKTQFPAGPVIKCFVISPKSILEKNCKEIVCFTPAGSQMCLGFKEHDLITCESKVDVAVSLRS